MGAGFLDVYEVTWHGQKKPIILYVNIYEKGLLKVPVGLSLKKFKYCYAVDLIQILSLLFYFKK
jgi:hypothetical protein